MNGNVEVVIPLRQWIQEEGLRDTHEQQANRFDPIRVKNQSILFQNYGCIWHCGVVTKRQSCFSQPRLNSNGMQCG